MKAAVISALVWAAFTFSASAANMFRVTVETQIECTGFNEACGETFSGSRILDLEPEHVGKDHILSTRAWVCDGFPAWVDVDSDSEPAAVGSYLSGYITLSPITGSLLSMRGRATGGIPGVGVNLFIEPACQAIFC